MMFIRALIGRIHAWWGKITGLVSPQRKFADTSAVAPPTPGMLVGSVQPELRQSGALPPTPPPTIHASITLHSLKGTPSAIVQTTILDSAVPTPQVTRHVVDLPWSKPTMVNLFIDEFGRLHSYCRTRGVVGDIYVGYRRVRAALWEERDKFPFACLLVCLPSDERALVVRSLELYLSPSPSTAANPVDIDVPPQRLAVATDGSVSARWHPGMGWACVSADGRYALGNSPEGSHIGLAELSAIELALHKFDGPLDIHTDSRDAITMIKNPDRAKTHETHVCAARISRLIKSSDSTLTWVKGHRGHRLNDKADRLARIARLELQGMYAGSAATVAERVARESD